MSRSTHAKAVLGDELYSKLHSSKTLVVGAGGIGCELLKNLVLSGFHDITLLDLDTIDLSNLNRQFLFRKKDVKQSKALVGHPLSFGLACIVAAATAKPFNPSVKIHPIHGNIKEPQFDVEWFKQFDIVLNALDNLDARRHVNKMCLAAAVPLVESGTAGYLGQVQPLLHHLSHSPKPIECFECVDKPVPKSFPVCTIRSTPSTPIHCIVWAKSYLLPVLPTTNLHSQLFGEEDDGELDKAATAGENASEIESLRQEAQAFKSVRTLLHNSSTTSTTDLPTPLNPNLSPAADAAASTAFTKVYDQDIRRLLAMSDMWLHRVPPVPLDRKAILTGEFVDPRKETPSDSSNSNGTGNENGATNTGSGSGLKDQKALSLRDNVELLDDSLRRLSERAPNEGVISFDKDDDDTLDFVTAAANLRAYAYGIEGKTRWEVKEMAGNIIPAIATTNAIIAGLIVIQATNVLKSLIPTPSPDPALGGAFARSSPKNVLIQTKARAPLGVQNLSAPNPHCAVCRPVYVSVACDPARTTLGEVVKGILKLGAAGEEEPREVSVYEAGRVLSEPDWEDNFEKTLESLNCRRGTILMIVDDAEELVDLAVCLTALPPDHPTDADSPAFILPTSLIPLPKRAPKPKEPSPPPPVKVTNGSKRSAVELDDEDEIQIIEPGASSEERPTKPPRTSGPNGSKRAPDDDTALERNAKRLRLVSAEVEGAEDEDEVVILE
ncbi:E1 ubiquitin-activating protein uba2 [Ceratobasidium sp. 414]|nr:E1 ubiquitin-activating protein uba2 [Ceratobasidium sp. 414]